MSHLHEGGASECAEMRHLLAHLERAELERHRRLVHIGRLLSTQPIGEGSGVTPAILLEGFKQCRESHCTDASSNFGLKIRGNEKGAVG